MHYLLGIDEAGRWPWAWPVVAAWFLIASDSVLDILGLADSKLVTEKNRERILSDIMSQEQAGKCFTVVAHRSAAEIDSLGIREANRACMQEVIRTLITKIGNDDTLEIWIDGCDNYTFDLETHDVGYDFPRLSAKKRRDYEPLRGDETIQIHYCIGWDTSIPVISAASIVAKVSRDHMMCEYNQEFPEYGFDTHKGYGTRKHRESLLYYGITPIHRKSYAPIKSLISHQSSL